MLLLLMPETEMFAMCSPLLWRLDLDLCADLWADWFPSYISLLQWAFSGLEPFRVCELRLTFLSPALGKENFLCFITGKFSEELGLTSMELEGETVLLWF